MDLWASRLLKLLEEAKVSPPEVQGFDPTYRPASSTQDPELHHFIVTATESTSNLHILSQSLLVC